MRCRNCSKDRAPGRALCQRCLQTTREAQQRYRARHPGRIVAIQRRSRHRGYGLAAGEYEARMRGQSERCPICGRSFSEVPQVDIDHDHVTGAVRGLLCTACNRAIGLLGDDPARMLAAADYIIRQSGVAIT